MLEHLDLMVEVVVAPPELARCNGLPLGTLSEISFIPTFHKPLTFERADAPSEVLVRVDHAPLRPTADGRSSFTQGLLRSIKFGWTSPK